LTIITLLAFIDISRQDELISSIEFRAWVAMIVGLLTLLFAFMRQKHNDMSVFFQLFEKFNQRYDDLNAYLNTINRITSDEELLRKFQGSHPFEIVGKNVSSKLKDRLHNDVVVKAVLDDYLNLCAEEHLAFVNGYIPPNIMKYWYNGMEIFFKNNHMRTYFKKELEVDSFYEFKNFALQRFEEIEKIADKK
jgi:hypothetical protein